MRLKNYPLTDIACRALKRGRSLHFTALTSEKLPYSITATSVTSGQMSYKAA